MKYNGLVENHRRLKKFYINLKDKNKKLKEDSDNYHNILKECITMRTILDKYYQSGNIDSKLLAEIDLESPHPILS